ncbi:MAG: hypothetical protein GXP62_09690 [Oligoflexia bacterium]|nr:hypothetical protein [Oligoflexia bacterium]
MPDLITHGAVGLLLGLAWVRRRPAPMLPLFVAGNLAPDLLTRVPAILAGEVDAKLVRLPPVLLYGWEPMHQPFGAALAACAIAMLFERGCRGRVFLSLYAGMLLHFLMDIFQFHEGIGIMMLYPFSTTPFEIGLVGSEASVWVALPLALLAGLAWWWLRWRAVGSTAPRAPAQE